MRLQSCWHKISQNDRKKFKKESVDKAEINGTIDLRKKTLARKKKIDFSWSNNCHKTKNHEFYLKFEFNVFFFFVFCTSFFAIFFFFDYLFNFLPTNSFPPQKIFFYHKFWPPFHFVSPHFSLQFDPPFFYFFVSWFFLSPVPSFPCLPIFLVFQNIYFPCIQNFLVSLGFEINKLGSALIPNLMQLNFAEIFENKKLKKVNLVMKMNCIV